MKIFVLVNTLQDVSSVIYSNHIHFFSASLKNWYKKYNNLDLDINFFTPHRMSIDNARNQAAVMALEQECDYLMFIDDDVLIPPDTLEKLLAADKDIIAGLVIIRGAPFNVMSFKYKKQTEKEIEAKRPRELNFYNEIPLIQACEAGHEVYHLNCEKCVLGGQLQELVECDAVGFSCALIKTDVLKALEPPYFVTSATSTEDVYFCIKLEDLVPKPTIFTHTGVRCGHMLNAEPIEWSNRPLMSAIYAPIAQKYVRNEEYIKQCLANLQ